MDTYDSSSNSIIGKAMVEMAERQKSAGNKLSEEDKILLKKMTILKKSEECGRLMWTCYQNWNNFTEKFRQQFISIIDPVLWNGVYFTLDGFFQNEVELMSRISKNNMVVLCKNGVNHQLFCIDMSAHDFNAKKYKPTDKEINFNGIIVKSYYISKNKLIIREYGRIKD